MHDSPLDDIIVFNNDVYLYRDVINGNCINLK